MLQTEPVQATRELPMSTSVQLARRLLGMSLLNEEETKYYHGPSHAFLSIMSCL